MSVPSSVLDQLVEAVASRASEIVLERLQFDPAKTSSSTSPYMTVAEAADYLRSKPQRVYDLISASRLSRVKESGRTLVLREEVEALAAVTSARRVAGVLPASRRNGTSSGVAR